MKKDISLILITIIITIILKLFFFYNLSTINNDDLKYIELSNNLFQNLFFSLDGEKLHTFYPPGYPIILGLEKIILLNWENVFLFNNLVITTLTSLIIFFILKKYLLNYYHIIFLPLILLYPIFTTGRTIINVSSEIIFSFIICLGTLFLFRFIYEKQKYVNLFFCNILFAFSYLIRPEGLLFFFILLLYQLIILKKDILKFKYFFLSFSSFCIFILSYVFFLYLNLGYITISPKHKVVSSVGEGLTNNNFLTKINNFIDLILFTPNLIHPILIPGIIFFFIGLFRNKINGENLKKLFFLFFPTLSFLVIIITKYFIIGRVIYQIIPFLILFSYIGYYQFFARYEKKFIFLSPFIIILFLASILVILKLEVSDNHSVLFKKSAKYFYDLEIKNKCILARDGKLEYYLPNNNIIVIGREKYAKKECNPEYILLSNLSHIVL